MKYLKKQIEIDTSGHINEYWECDFTTTDLSQLGSGLISVYMKGCKDLESRQSGKHFSDLRPVTVTSTDLELQGAIGYQNIPKLYEVLATKTVKQEVVNEDNTISEIDIPAYPDFFGGLIEDMI